jgi:hypothetical protein
MNYIYLQILMEVDEGLHNHFMIERYKASSPRYPMMLSAMAYLTEKLLIAPVDPRQAGDPTAVYRLTLKGKDVLEAATTCVS